MLLETLGLQEQARAPTHTLSGGMRRRLEVARALLPNPRLLLLDEPTVGLDPDARQALWEYLTAAVQEGTTLVLATNDVAEAERYCTEVAFLSRGRCVTQGTPAELKRGLKRDSVRVEWPSATAEDAVKIAAWPGVGGAALSPPTLHVTVDDAAAFVPRLFRFARDGIHTIHVDRSTLEDAYFRLVGSPLGGPERTPP